MNLINILFIYTIKVKKNITLRHFVFLTLAILIGMYGFALFGNARVNNSYGIDEPITNGDMILLIGGATEEFRNSVIPDAFFWIYLYISSPLANLQNTIINFDRYEVSLDNFSLLIVHEVFPDFISSRLTPFTGIFLDRPVQITPELTVGTAFVRSYIIFGWFGMIIYTLILFLFGYIYTAFAKKISRSLFLTGYVTLCTLFLFSYFANMLTFSGLSFQLVYPLLANKIFEIKY